MKALTLSILAASLLTFTVHTRAQDISIYSRLSINSQEPYDWLSRVPSSVTASPTYTPDWQFLERMQSTANRQYNNSDRQRASSDYDPNTLVCHYHVVSTWNRATKHWDESPAMYNAASFMFFKIGIAYTELIPGADPFTNLFTLKAIDTTADTRESTLVKWYAEDGQRHEKYKVTYFMNKIQRNVVMIFQRFDNDGNEWQRYSFVIDN